MSCSRRSARSAPGCRWWPLRWPAAADELHGCSAHSAYHDAWLEQLQQEQEHHHQQQYVSEDADSFSAGDAHADGSNGVDGGCEAALLSRSSAVVAAATLTAAGPDTQSLSHQHPFPSTLAVARAYFPPRVGAYDMLVRDGPTALLWHARHQAVNLPLRGLYQFDAFAKEVLDLYRAVRELPWSGGKGVVQASRGSLVRAFTLPCTEGYLHYLAIITLP